MKNIFLLSTALLLFMACQPSENQAVNETTNFPETYISSTEPSSTPANPDQEIEYPGEQQIPRKVDPRESSGFSPVTQLASNGPHPPKQLELIPELAAKTQIFRIDAKKGASLRGAKGTLLQIPAHAFVDENGKPVSGKVEFRLKESMSRLDLIAGGLSTRADDQLLYSGGVIAVEAHADGKKLDLAEGSEVLVEFPQVEDQADMKLWLAEEDEDGYLNWQEETEAEKSMILIPLEALALDQAGRDPVKDSLLAEARKNKGVWRKSEHDLLLEKLGNPQSQESWLATREFKQRLITLKEHALEYGLLSAYLGNQKKDLWEADKKVLDDLYFIKRTNAKGHENKSLDKAIAAFEWFVEEKKERAEVIPTFDFDLSSANAYEQLLAQGIEAPKARRYLQVHQTSLKLEAEERIRSEKAAADRKRNQSLAATSNAISLAYESPKIGKRFRLVRLGTFNNDGPIQIFKPIEFEVPVVAENAKLKQFTRCFLVLRGGGQNTFLELKSKGNGDFGAANVPPRKRGTLVALSYLDGKYYLGTRGIVTKRGQAESIRLHPVTMDKLEVALVDLKVASS